MKISHCPTVLYLKDPEIPGTAKVRKRLSDLPVGLFKKKKKLHASSNIQSELRHMDYVNINHNPKRVETIDL